MNLNTSELPPPVRIQQSISRLAYFILFSEVEYVLLPDVVEFFPKDISNRDIKKLLLDLDVPEGESESESEDTDYVFRFIDQGGDDLLIGIQNLSEDFKSLLINVEEWKLTMCQVLEKLEHHQIEFSTFEIIVPRPPNVPQDILLKDVLHADSQHRFSWYGPSDNICIQGPLQPEIRQQLIQQKLEDALTRARYFIFFSKKEYIRLEFLLHCFPTMFLWCDICESLENDPLKRFKTISRNIFKNKKEYFIGLASTLENDQLLIDNIDEWRNMMARQLERSDNKELKLSILARDRPDTIFQHKTLRKKAKMFDVLRSDPLHRFSISGIAINLIVTLAPQPSPQEEKALTELWCKNISTFFHAKKRSKLVMDLERDVRRPFGLNTELIHVLQHTVPSNQFTNTISSRGLPMTTLSPKSDVFNQQQLQLWRKQIIDYLINKYGPTGPIPHPVTPLSSQSASPNSSDSSKASTSKTHQYSPTTTKIKREKRRFCKISEVVKNVREPWPLVWNGSVVSVLEEDPLNRFILEEEASPGTYFVSLNQDTLLESMTAAGSGDRNSVSRDSTGASATASASASSVSSKHNTLSKPSGEGRMSNHADRQKIHHSQANTASLSSVSENENTKLENVWYSKVFNYINSKKRPVLPSDLKKHVPRPAGLDCDVDVLAALKTDSKQRFVGVKTTRGPQLVSLRINEEEEEQMCEEWRVLIFNHLLTSINQSNNKCVEMSKLGQAIPHPWLLVRRATLQEVLRADPLKRFELEGTGDDVAAKVSWDYLPSSFHAVNSSVSATATATATQKNSKKQTTTVVSPPPTTTLSNSQRQEWCDKTALYLTWHRRTLCRQDLHDMGLTAAVMDDFIRHLRAEPKERFDVLETSKGIPFINFRITDAERDELMLEWRKDIFNYLFVATQQNPNNCSVGITQLHAQVPRPWLLPRSCTLHGVIKPESDPSKSFHLSDGVSLMVSLNEDNATRKKKYPIGCRVEDEVISRIMGFNYNEFVLRGASDGEGDSLSTDREEIFRCKVAKYMMWYRQLQVPLSELSKSIRTDFKMQQLGTILENDPHKRFHCQLLPKFPPNEINKNGKTNDTIKIKVISCCISDSNKQEILCRWLDMVSSYMENRTRLNPQYLSTIGGISKAIPCQWYICDTPQVLLDALRDDPQQRFEVIQPTKDLSHTAQSYTVRLLASQISEKSSLFDSKSSQFSSNTPSVTIPKPTEGGNVPHAHAVWCDRILSFLHSGKRQQTVDDIEDAIPRPNGISRDVSLLNILDEDPQHRFFIRNSARSGLLVSPAVSDREMLSLLEEWKFNALTFLVKNSTTPASSGRSSVVRKGISVHSLSRFVSRNWLVPRQYSLINLMQSDPLSRFVFNDGNDIYSPVTLSCSEAEKKSLLTMTFSEYFFNLEEKHRIPSSCLLSPAVMKDSAANSSNANTSQHSLQQQTTPSETKKNTHAAGEDTNAVDEEDDSILEAYMKSTEEYIRKIKRGVPQPELDREIPKPKYVLDSFQTLLSDSQNRFIEARNSRNTQVIILPISTEESKQFLEEWMSAICRYVQDSSANVVSIYDIARDVIRPWLLPRPVSLGNLLKRDALQRFHVDGKDKNAIVTIIQKSPSSLTPSSLLTDVSTAPVKSATASAVSTAPMNSLTDSAVSTSTHIDKLSTANTDGNTTTKNDSALEVASASAIGAYIETVGLYLKKIQRSVDQTEVDRECTCPPEIKNSFQFFVLSPLANDQFEIIENKLCLKISSHEKECILERWKLRVITKLLHIREQDPWRSVTVGCMRDEVQCPWQLPLFDMESVLRSDELHRFTLSGDGDSARLTFVPRRLSATSTSTSTHSSKSTSAFASAPASASASAGLTSKSSFFASTTQHTGNGDGGDSSGGGGGGGGGGFAGVSHSMDNGSTTHCVASHVADSAPQDYQRTSHYQHQPYLVDQDREERDREADMNYFNIETKWGTMNKLQTEEDDAYIFDEKSSLQNENDQNLLRFNNSSTIIGESNSSNHINNDDLMMGAYDVSDLVDVNRACVSPRTPVHRRMSFMQHLDRQQDMSASSLLERHSSTLNCDSYDTFDGEENVIDQQDEHHRQPYQQQQQEQQQKQEEVVMAQAHFPLTFPSPHSLTSGLESEVNIMGSFPGIFASNSSLMMPDASHTPTTAATLPMTLLSMPTPDFHLQPSLHHVLSAETHSTRESDYSPRSESQDLFENICRSSLEPEPEPGLDPLNYSPPPMFSSLQSDFSLSLSLPPGAAPSPSDHLLATPPRPHISTASPFPSPTHQPQTHTQTQTQIQAHSTSPKNGTSSPGGRLGANSRLLASPGLPPGLLPPPPGVEITDNNYFNSVAHSTNTTNAMAAKANANATTTPLSMSLLPEPQEEKTMNWARIVTEGKKSVPPPPPPPPKLSPESKPLPSNVLQNKRQIFPSTTVYCWLQLVFSDGHSLEYIQDMSTKFEKEGLVTCADMLQADAQCRLTLELLEPLGYGLEHLEKLLLSLDWIKEEEK
jgi:hypothetical protein